MKRLFLAAAVFFGLASASAQPGTPNDNAIKNEGRAPYRTAFISYDIRKEADSGEARGSKYYRQLTFKPSASSRQTLFEATCDIPQLWLDRDVYIRDEGRTGRYRLRINDREVGLNTDSYGTNDFYITPYLRGGVNKFSIEFASDVPGGDMEDFTPAAGRTAIGNLFVWSQPRIHILDYAASGYPNPDGPDAFIDLAVVLVNGYNMEETVTVGYDVYDPTGKLKEYTFAEVTLPGQGCDTVRFRNKLFGTEKFRYSADNPQLYKVMLSVKHQGRNIEYIPFRFGFGTTQFDGERILRNGKAIAVSAVEYDASGVRNTLSSLQQMKRRGINTLYVTHPQQQWFYDMCEENGMYIVDRAAVECDPKGGERGPHGTVANDPAHLRRFVDRQQNMYHRGKNRANVIGWSIGSDSGNGYNMYKSYQWLKGTDSDRIVVYPFADGEWNTDAGLPAPQPLDRILQGATSR